MPEVIALPPPVSVNLDQLVQNLRNPSDFSAEETAIAPALLALLEEPNPDWVVRFSATEALKNLGYQP
jgi:HEAT repeat protein